MARPREFDEQSALEQAMQVFWSQGFEATSMTDLTAAMGLSKSSLYDTFGSKHELFLATIDHYKDNVTAQVRSAAELDVPARQLIASLFGRAVDHMTDGSGQRGCFLNNCAVEVGPHDPEAAERCRAGLAVMEDSFQRLVLRSQDESGIAEAKDARALARFLTGAINGIMVIGKANPDREVLNDIAAVALTALD
jgi:TetR/AcrR family transcriptional repressor of nem operon